jgi:hypothetical protein
MGATPGFPEAAHRIAPLVDGKGVISFPLTSNTSHNEAEQLRGGQAEEKACKNGSWHRSAVRGALWPVEDLEKWQLPVIL